MSSKHNFVRFVSSAVSYLISSWCSLQLRPVWIACNIWTDQIHSAEFFNDANKSFNIWLTWHETQLTDSHLGHLNSLTPSSQMHHPSQFTSLQWIALRVVISAMRSVRIRCWSNSFFVKMPRISRSCKTLSHLVLPSPNGHATSASSQWMIVLFKQSRQNWCKQFRKRTPSSVLIVVKQMTQSNGSAFVITPPPSSSANNWMYNGNVVASVFLVEDSVVLVTFLLSSVRVSAEAIVDDFVHLREVFLPFDARSTLFWQLPCELCLSAF